MEYIQQVTEMLNSRIGFRALHLILIAAAGVSATASPHSASQQDQNLSKLASDTSQYIAITHKQHVLLAPVEGCLLDMALCEAAGDALRATLQREAPTPQFIDREKLVSQVKKHGLLEIDSFDRLVVKSLGNETGAEVVVMMTVRWDGDHYNLVNEMITDSAQNLVPSCDTPVSPNVTGDAPLLFPDPETGVFSAVPRRGSSSLGVFRYPQCQLCEKPRNYAAPDTYQEFRMRVTITEQGRVEQIAVLSPAPSFATDKTAEALKSDWRFAPAINSDGKPFPIRANLRVVFWQGHMTWDISY